MRKASDNRSSKEKAKWRMEIWGDEKSCNWRLSTDKHALFVHQLAIRMIKDVELYTLIRDALRVSTILENAEKEAKQMVKEGAERG